MKTFRIIDMLLQLFLILTGLTLGIKNLFGSSNFYIYFYFIVGGWQITGMIIHHIFATPTLFYAERTTYAKFCVLIFVITIVLGSFYFFAPDLLFLFILFAFLLLWISPFLAIYYLLLSWKEYRLITKRDLIHLK